MSREFALHGATLLRGGWPITPIAPCSKRPALSDWPQRDLTLADIERMGGNGHANDGIGIRTGVGPTPICALDIDSYDPAIVDRMRNYLDLCFGVHAERVGQPPKTLIPYRAAAPWKKRTVKLYKDTAVQKLEVLGTGQQFVAFGIHPDTRQPFRWTRSAVDFSVSDLPLITESDLASILEAFRSIGHELGYTADSPQKEPSESPLVRIPDPPVDMSLAEVEKLLENQDLTDYGNWIAIGQALHHQFQGGSTGLNLWDRLSRRAPNYRDFEDLEYRWAGFGRRTDRLVTLRSFIPKGHQRKADPLPIRETIRQCADSQALLNDIGPQIQEQCQGNRALLLEMGKLLQDQFKTLTGANLPAADVRRILLKKTAADNGWNTWARECPEWARDWVYVSSEDRFLNVHSGIRFTPEGFKGTFDCYLIDEETNAYQHVTKKNLIPKVDKTLYLPGVGRFFQYGQSTCVNLYRPEEHLPDFDTKAPAILKRHLELFFGGGQWTRECQLVANYFRHNIEHPGKKIRWALLIQGQYGDGKGQYGDLFGRILGIDNVRIIHNSTIIGSAFNAWAAAHCMGFIEEIKLHGHNKYDIVNTLKPIITNDRIEIHSKGKDPTNVPNTANYVLLTNFKDAIPIDDKDRRYCILFSKFPLDYIRETEPDYFVKLTSAFRDHPAAIADWLRTVPYHADFDSQGNPPATADRLEAISLARNDSSEAIREAIDESSDPRWGPELVMQQPLLGHLQDQAIMAHGSTVTLVALKRALIDLGYTHIGRRRVPPDGERQRLWVRGAPAEGIDAWVRQILDDRSLA